MGGHFSVLTNERRNQLPAEKGYESARACLFALVKALSPRRVFIPNYVCSAVPSALHHAECTISYYAIDDNFSIIDKIDIHRDDLIILVNYFGLCSDNIESQLSKLPREHVVVDNSQAFFQSPFDCLASIYSIRKFLPVPDGGLIHTNVQLPTEAPNEGATLDRFAYLLRRVGSEPGLSRSEYLESERSLEVPTLRSLSSVTRRIAAASDHDFIASQRRSNFLALKQLDDFNMLSLNIGDQVPLCYPLAVKGAAGIREELKSRGIFTPHFWPGISPRSKKEARLCKDTIFLPIDHRYAAEDMQNLAKIVSDAVKRG